MFVHAGCEGGPVLDSSVGVGVLCTYIAKGMKEGEMIEVRRDDRE